MRFSKVECHFTTRGQVLAEIAGVGWHGVIAFRAHPSKLAQPVDKPLSSLRQAGRPGA